MQSGNFIYCISLFYIRFCVENRKSTFCNIVFLDVGSFVWKHFKTSKHRIAYTNPSPLFLFIVPIGEPQEECIRCGKMYILRSDTNKGLCGKCLGIPRDQMKSLPFRSSGESTEEEEDEEESSNGGTEFSDK